MKHEHRAGQYDSGRGIEPIRAWTSKAVLVPHYGYPKDTSILDDADTVVIFCDRPSRAMSSIPQLEEFDMP